ncbi:hypothetical protein CBR_g23340 [Chara braunii]|uniref:Acyltransferase n=1 Tax=Chara braunii TaxID=69332 RepID=A0A388L3Y2_CHABU|nr:hypothetical protein CBR_g23340 [Chara braunii]|eukprot:GBG77010.1 hypothetical protein CBR_g23340 [Chara braunii]
MGIALFIWVGGFHVNLLFSLLILCNLPGPVGIALLCVYLTLAFIPVKEDSSWGRELCRFACSTVVDYFPISLKFEERDSLDPGRAYVIGLEPHSVLPLSAVVLSPLVMKTPFPRIKMLGSSALKHVPFARHVWTWMGVADVSKSSFDDLLRRGWSCVVVPGGVQECLYMEKDKEVIFLKQRRGFVRMAMATGSPLVPVFGFGQSHTYYFWLPKGQWFRKLSRMIHYVPMLYWGIKGSPVPVPGRMLVVVGRPIEVPCVKNPTPQQVSEVHDKFVKAMEDIYERHKREGGMEGVPLVIK